MKASVCFITCGLHNHVAPALSTLFQCTSLEYEIVIYKNNTDFPFTLYRGYDNDGKPHLSNTLIFGGISKQIDGIAIARNKCISKSSGDVIIWIDDDIVVCKDFVPAFITPFETDKKIGIVGYDACRIDENFMDLCHIDPFEVQPDYFDSPYAISRSMIIDIGGYDEELGKYDCDNTDLCLRARKNGWELQPILNPGIAHWMGSTRNVLKKIDQSEWRKSTSKMIRNHPRGWRQQCNLSTDKINIDPDKQYKPGLLRI